MTEKPIIKYLNIGLVKANDRSWSGSVIGIPVLGQGETIGECMKNLGELLYGIEKYMNENLENYTKDDQEDNKTCI